MAQMFFTFWYICWHSIANLQSQSDHSPQRVVVGGWGGGGGTLILFDTCVGSRFVFFWFKILNYLIFGGVSEIFIFLEV